MPLTYTVHASPGGKPYLRTVSRGAVTASDAAMITELIAPGRPHFGTAFLAVVEPGADYSAEARKAFSALGSGDGNAVPVAMVVTSAPMRVLMSFIIRMTGSANTTKFFGDEAAAAQWLHERLDQGN